MPEAADFKKELHRMMRAAAKSGSPTIDVNAGVLHRRVGDYSDPQRERMPLCCEVMMAALNADAGDKVINEPPSGAGASLTIRYVLPRPAEFP
jgi:5-methylcytosine-specific restriction protein A